MARIGVEPGAQPRLGGLGPPRRFEAGEPCRRFGRRPFGWALPAHHCSIHFISCSVARATCFSTAATDIFSERAISAKGRSEEHTSELQSLMRISYAVFCLKKKNTN